MSHEHILNLQQIHIGQQYRIDLQGLNKYTYLRALPDIAMHSYFLPYRYANPSDSPRFYYMITKNGKSQDILCIK